MDTDIATTTNTRQHHHQDNIGWDLLLRGFIAKEFDKKYQRHFRQQFQASDDPDADEKAQKLATDWTVDLVTLTWTEMHSLWKLRCKEVHDPSGH